MDDSLPLKLTFARSPGAGISRIAVTGWVMAELGPELNLKVIARQTAGRYTVAGRLRTCSGFEPHKHHRTLFQKLAGSPVGRLTCLLVAGRLYFRWNCRIPPGIAGSPLDRENCDDCTKSPAVASHHSTSARRLGPVTCRRLVHGGGLAGHTALGWCDRIPGDRGDKVCKGVAKGFIAVLTRARAHKSIASVYGTSGTRLAAPSCL